MVYAYAKAPNMYRDEAEHLVRNKLNIPPEKEVQGFDYLRVLEEETGDFNLFSSATNDIAICNCMGAEATLLFNLTTGKPATEADAKEFINLVT